MFLSGYEVNKIGITLPIYSDWIVEDSRNIMSRNISTEDTREESTPIFLNGNRLQFLRKTAFL